MTEDQADSKAVSDTLARQRSNRTPPDERFGLMARTRFVRASARVMRWGQRKEAVTCRLLIATFHSPPR